MPEAKSAVGQTTGCGFVLPFLKKKRGGGGGRKKVLKRNAVRECVVSGKGGDKRDGVCVCVCVCVCVYVCVRACVRASVCV